MLKNRINDKFDLIIQIDDYHDKNFELARLISDHGFKATFFINTLPIGAEDQVITLDKMGMEVGGHTMTHPKDIKLLPIDEARGDIEGGKSMIESWTFKPCKTFAYPSGRYSDETVRLVQESGFESARGTHVFATEYDDIFRMKTTLHMFDGRREYKGKRWDSFVKKYWDHCMENGGYFLIWGHAFELMREEGFTRFRNFLTFAQEQTEKIEICQD